MCRENRKNGSVTSSEVHKSFIMKQYTKINKGPVRSQSPSSRPPPSLLFPATRDVRRASSSACRALRNRARLEASHSARASARDYANSRSCSSSVFLCSASSIFLTSGDESSDGSARAGAAQCGHSLLFGLAGSIRLRLQRRSRLYLWNGLFCPRGVACVSLTSFLFRHLTTGLRRCAVDFIQHRNVTQRNVAQLCDLALSSGGKKSTLAQ